MKDERVVDTTRFSGVESQLPPNQSNSDVCKTPPALAAWSINFSLPAPNREAETESSSALKSVVSFVFTDVCCRRKLKLHATRVGGVFCFRRRLL